MQLVRKEGLYWGLFRGLDATIGRDHHLHHNNMGQDSCRQPPDVAGVVCPWCCQRVRCPSSPSTTRR